MTTEERQPQLIHRAFATSLAALETCAQALEQAAVEFDALAQNRTISIARSEKLAYHTRGTSVLARDIAAMGKEHW